ncbi:PREDICTED: interferon-induced very large GTPase 1-like [Cyprinodon variegatus]|uniref:interferon-induced very large GTPase 1-like n=1 Tax=Cyprinodon variegatus TaxID=28743 RepID=UPI000742516B|nr:PREDICTED: interferon-induced very large GTPase 1-like [Cyprinodon variegatus]
MDQHSPTEANENKVNYLDLIVALFLCADSFLQQRMALRMSMCQFSFPLLLPHYNNSQSGLMLWTLRDIVKEWNSVAEIKAPFFSFVRLKNSSLSKSQLLNHILSHGQQNKDVFMHRDMEGGAHQREIANGLIEISWFLPSGRENQDVFQKPIIFANLRGDVSESPTEFSFLSQVSTAIFVLMDKIQEDEKKMLTSLHDVKSKLFFVFSPNKNTMKDTVSVKTMVEKLDIPKNQVITKDQKTNIAGFSKKFCATINKSPAHLTSCMSIVNMSDKAMELGLSVDEHRSDTQKKAAERIMEGIWVKTISDYKKQELCLQGENWKKISKIEKEECRLNKADDSTLEDYKAELQKEKEALRKEQSKYKPSNEMKMFIESLSVNDKEKRDFFFKWMKLELDSYTRINFSQLRNKLQIEHEKENVKAVAELGQTLLDSSLGIEHYMREMGLIYEFSHETTEEITRLPRLAAEMVLDGHPLELLDGDASNIPEKWVSAVLNEVHMLVGGRSRLLVLTVLGVQSSGKSTLLNTMFGVQFPVSSGRCTRGAYMILLPVGEDLKSVLNYDFVVLIDTEGLKSPQMAQLEDSYEHDNQLATFVIGLSDITIINIAMENATEMKDILQIAVHAFIRMREIGKRPVCHFVHQNVAGISAHSMTMTDRKCLLDHLNEMTEIAAEMEMQSSVKLFTDVLDYDMEKNNWYIPGLWLGTPPMASVSTGYSQAVAELKKNLLMTKRKNINTDESRIPEFLEWMKSLWKAVKYENFIFSFRNTLVAKAYDNLWREFNQWEWEFRKQILTRGTEAEMEISNANTESDQDLFNLIDSKKDELSEIIDGQKELRKQFQEEFSRSDDVADTISKLSVKPQDELFRKVFGCGRQCPFCKVPCDAGGKQHLQHQAAVHRPKGLGGYRYETNDKLVETLCTTSVNSEQRFRNTDTDWKYHPNKKYMKIYPNWKIPPDSTIEASDYWKYVLVKYNDRFAKMYKAKPADIPVAWKNITKEQALKGLKDAFNMRENNTELTD